MGDVASGVAAAIDHLRHDLKVAVRMLRRAPAVSIASIMVLALGIGTATVLYAVIYAMWLRPLPYPDAGRLVSVNTYFAGYKLDALVSPDYGTWQGTRALGPLAAFSLSNAALESRADTTEVALARVSGNLFEALRVKAATGRTIQPVDDTPQAAPVVLLTDKLWREQFGSEAHITGRPVRLDGQPYTVIGVLPGGFRMPDERRVDALVPMALTENWLRHGSSGAMKILRGVARLQPGITLAEARAELEGRLAASRAQAPKFYGNDVALRMVPLQEYVVRNVRTTALVLLGAVLSILLIASANVASLLVARAAGREREMAVRIALGASARQIARQLLVEGLAVGLAGAAGGIAVALALLEALNRAELIAFLHAAAPVVNLAVLASAIGAALVCSLLFSLAPVLPFSRLHLRRALVVGELAVSLSLLVTAALLLGSLVKLHSVPLGLAERVVTAALSVKGSHFEGRPAELRRELRERLESVPGISAVSFADALPPLEAARITTFSRSDRPSPEAFHRGDNVVIRLVDTQYFEAMGIRILDGRAVIAADLSGDGLVAIVNRTLAQRYFAGEETLGKQVDGLGQQWKTVVGVAADIRNDGLRNPVRPEIYLPLMERNQRGGGVTQNTGLQVVIRAAGDPEAVVSVMRGHLRALDRTLLAKVQTMDEQRRSLESGPRFQAMIFSGFAALALLMACTGVYGVLAHMVALRRREIGIRMALGAGSLQVQGLIVREALFLASAGVVLGIAGALAEGRLLAGLLFEVSPRDPLTLAATSALLILLAVCASALPAREASRQDPAQTLRAE